MIRASALVPLGLESFEKNDTNALSSDVYQAKASIMGAYSLEQRKKNSLTAVILESLTQPNFGHHPLQPWAQGVKARLVNLRWDAITLSGGRAYPLQGMTESDLEP